MSKRVIAPPPVVNARWTAGVAQPKFDGGRTPNPRVGSPAVVSVPAKDVRSGPSPNPTSRPAHVAQPKMLHASPPQIDVTRQNIPALAWRRANTGPDVPRCSIAPSPPRHHLSGNTAAIAHTAWGNTGARAIQAKGKLFTRAQATALITNQHYVCEIVIDSTKNFKGEAGAGDRWSLLRDLTEGKISYGCLGANAKWHAEDDAIYELLRGMEDAGITRQGGTMSVRISAAPCKRCARNLYNVAVYLKRVLRIKATVVTHSQKEPEDSGREGVKFLAQQGVPFRIWREADREGEGKVWTKSGTTLDTVKYRTWDFVDKVRAALERAQKGDEERRAEFDLEQKNKPVTSSEDSKKRKRSAPKFKPNGSIPHYISALSYQETYQTDLEFAKTYHPLAGKKWSKHKVSNKVDKDAKYSAEQMEARQQLNNAPVRATKTANKKAK